MEITNLGNMKWLYSFILSIFTVFQLSSQYIDMKFIDPFAETELSSLNVNCINQDTMGNIWIATRNGLNSYNGYEIKSYFHDFNNENTLLDHEIKQLYIDSKGRLWAGSKNGICLYNPLKDNFIRLAHASDSNGLMSFEIKCFNEDEDGNLYVSNTDEILIFDELTKKFKQVYKAENGEISSFVFDQLNNIWIGNFKGGGLTYYNIYNKESIQYLKGEDDHGSISSNDINDLAIRGQNLWIATIDGGINNLNLKNKIFHYYHKDSQYEKYTKSIYIDKENRLWVIDVTGLRLYDDSLDIFYGYYYNVEDPFTLKHSIVDIFQDRQNNYWTGYSQHGVSMRIVPKGFEYFNTQKNRFWYTSFETISAVCDDSLGNLWIGNPQNGIDIFNWTKEKIFVYTHDPNNKYSLGQGTVHFIYRDIKNVMWTGTHMGGLQYYSPDIDGFITYKNEPNNPHSIANNDIRSIAEDQDGTYWIVTHGRGIDNFDPKTGKFKHYTHANNELSNDYAFQVLIDSKNNLWVATVWGLCLLDRKTDKFINFYFESTNEKSISNSEINVLYEDSNDNIWIGTINGLNKFNWADSSFIRYGEGFNNTNIETISIDNEGKLWLGTIDGISVFDPVTYYYRNFDKSDGLITDGIYTRSFYQNEMGTIFIGGSEGLVMINPDKITINNEVPKVYISKLKLFYKEVDTNGKDSPLKTNISYIKTLKLDYTQKYITFAFVANNLITPEKNRYKYMMEGFDKEWIESEGKREATYTNLDAKKYVFRVIACNNDGVWNETGTSLELIITPPWWETVLFRIFIVLSIFALFILFFLLRTRQLRKQKTILEKQVKDRTRELRQKNKLLEKQTDDLNDINTLLEERQQHIVEQSEKLKIQTEELSAMNDDLKEANATKNKILSIIGHDLKDPFNSILGFADYLDDEYENTDDDERKRIIGAIKISSHKVHTLLDNLLKWARGQSLSITLNKKNTVLKELINESYEVLKSSIKKKNIEINIDIPDELAIYADKDTTETILRNLTNNAIKFTPLNGSINISAIKSRGMVNIFISDTGVGMSEEVRANLFNPEINRTTQGTNGEKGTGLGLLICKEFANLNNGKLTVMAQSGKGSTFCLSLPSAISN